MYIHIVVMNIHIYIYICIEREREIEREIGRDITAVCGGPAHASSVSRTA